MNNKVFAVVLTAYDAGKTATRAVAEIPREIVDNIILTADASRDNTMELAEELGLFSIRHDQNAATGRTRKPATPLRWHGEPTSSSCSIRTTNTLRTSLPQWSR